MTVQSGSESLLSSGGGEERISFITFQKAILLSKVSILLFFFKETFLSVKITLLPLIHNKMCSLSKIIILTLMLYLSSCDACSKLASGSRK